MHHVIGALAIGAIGGRAAGNAEKRRRMVGGLIKGGMAAKRKMETAASMAIAETKKLVEEARAELDHTGTEPRN